LYNLQYIYLFLAGTLGLATGLISELKYVTPWKLPEIALAIASGAQLQQDMLLPIAFNRHMDHDLHWRALWKIEKLEI